MFRSAQQAMTFFDKNRTGFLDPIQFRSLFRFSFPSVTALLIPSYPLPLPLPLPHPLVPFLDLRSLLPTASQDKEQDAPGAAPS